MRWCCQQKRTRPLESNHWKRKTDSRQHRADPRNLPRQDRKFSIRHKILGKSVKNIRSNTITERIMALTFQKMMFSISIRAAIPVPCHLRLCRHRPEIAQAIYVTAHFPSFSWDTENHMKCVRMCVCTRMFSLLARFHKTSISRRPGLGLLLSQRWWSPSSQYCDGAYSVYRICEHTHAR